MRALEVSCGRERDHVGAVGDAEDGKLWAFEQLLDHDGRAAATEPTLDQHGVDSRVRFGAGGAHDHTLAAREAVGLDRNATTAFLCPQFGGSRVRERLEVRGGDARVAHEVLGEGLARLDAARAAVRSEHIEAGVTHGVPHRCVDRRLWAQDDEPEALAAREVDELHDVGGGDRLVARHAAGAAVTGRAEDPLDEVGLDALPNERMFTRARADNQNLQRRVIGA